MEKVYFARIEVDRCTNCQGLFFDELEKDALQEAPKGDRVDIGDRQKGRQYNKIHPIDCPRCGGRMIRMVDVDQPHIWFEKCGACGGAFFDAGEFRDLKHHTIADYVRDLFAKERNRG